MKNARIVRTALALAVCSSAVAAAPVAATARTPGRVTVADPAQYVVPFVGTRPGAPSFGLGDGAGNTFPGAAAPLGMVQWSPDTVAYQYGGYAYDDDRIRGFSLTHISGAGCGDYGNIPFLPVLDGAPADFAEFSHADESASPGSYAVTFGNGVRTELAATPRSGIARFSYPAGHTASLTVDPGQGFNDASGYVALGTDSISGYTDSGGFCGTANRYRIYFSVVFDRPFSSSGIVAAGRVDTGRRSASGSSKGIAPQPARTAAAQAARPAGGGEQQEGVRPEAVPRASGAKALVSFDTAAGPTVTARVGISFVSVEGARANLAAEQAGAGFDQVRDAARRSWNDLLGRVAVGGGTTRERRVLYTALYHAMLHPSVLSDSDGRYPGFDGQVHTVPAGHARYADFSGWDVYRSQTQLLALLAPAEAADIAASIVDQGARAGYFDRWTLAADGTGVMVGDPLPIIAAGIHAFGATGFDAAALVRQAVAGRQDDRERPGHGPYDRIGYVPAGTDGTWGSAATTLEYTSADFAVAQLAARIGDGASYDLLMHRSTGWRSLFNGASGYLQPRRSDHAWPAFTPDQQDEYVEGSAAQYTWMVPYNHRGLFDAMGGDGAVTARLDAFLADLNAGPGSEHAFMGNEPSLKAPWAYVYAGRPDRTQDVVRRALTTLFGDGPDGEVGNDDLGELSAWAVWAALGMYPQVPGRAELVLAGPLFPAVTVRRGGDGPVIELSAPGASAAARYVHGLAVDGRASTRPWVGEDFVRNGGRLDFTLGTDPAPGLGGDPADAPPSFDVGPARPVTGAVGGPAAKCLDVRSGGTADGTPVQLYGCNGTEAQRWTRASDGTLRALGKCLDVSASRSDAGAPVQLWQCNDTGAQQWWPKADGTLVSTPSGRCLDLAGGATADGTPAQLSDCAGTGARAWTVPG
ncbi:GH92 family glycosyl hydrolase [Kitasatospora sp. MBT63]|uniref:GH92 family glycosyl hydrolase n=1 Tax=Kitasatospora sp. MBT63 TaxID=1444768 RepID=UPI0007C6E7DD|nr:GH92 family glycosyl hydrolase [Kitasatospora sp. MBT63]